MNRALAWTGQILLYAMFALVIAVFSRWPAYPHLAADQALVKLSLVHHGERLQDCVAQSPEELAKLPANMRAPMKCGRERAPVTVEVDIDGVLVHQQTRQPAGLSRDGAVAIYQRLPVSAGQHRIAVRVRDSARSSGFDHSREAEVTLTPAQVLVIDFSAEHGGITLL